MKLQIAKEPFRVNVSPNPTVKELQQEIERLYQYFAKREEALVKELETKLTELES